MRNSIAKKEISVSIKVEKSHKRMLQHSKEFCNKVEELEKETSISTKDEEKITEDYRGKKIYVVIEFRAAKNDKCCNKIFMSRHKTLMSRHKLDNFSRTMSGHYQSLSRHNPRRNPKIMSRQKTRGHMTRAGEQRQKLCHDRSFYVATKHLIGP